MAWTYTFSRITCDTCTNIGGGSFTNSQELTVGNYYTTPSIPYKLLILGLVSVNPGTPAYYILNSSGATTCEGISCPTTTTTSTSSTTTTTTTPTPVILPVVTICSQEWTTENLDVATYSDGTVIPQSTTDADWIDKGTNEIGAWCYFNNDPTTGDTYGKLYNWYAVNDSRGLAPVGYHIPTDAEWSTLTDTCLEGELIAGGKMKSTGTSLWNDPNTEATNSSGFTGLPGGFRDINGTFYYIGLIGYWWSSTEFDTTFAWYRPLYYNDGYAFRPNSSKKWGMSVRLIKD